MNYTLNVNVIEEAGYSSAMEGLALNKKQTSEKMQEVAQRLCNADHGHNKFLEHIHVWLLVEAPRYWWSQADTYRLTSKSSESTMHTLLKELKNEDITIIMDRFESVYMLPEVLRTLQSAAKANRPIHEIKALLPESFLQKRMWVLNYKNLREIFIQRYNHRLPHWRSFCDQVLAQLEHPELLQGVIDD